MASGRYRGLAGSEREGQSLAGQGREVFGWSRAVPQPHGERTPACLGHGEKRGADPRGLSRARRERAPCARGGIGFYTEFILMKDDGLISGGEQPLSWQGEKQRDRARGAPASWRREGRC